MRDPSLRTDRSAAEHINKLKYLQHGLEETVFNIMERCFKYLYIRKCLIEMKGAAMTIKME